MSKCVQTIFNKGYSFMTKIEKERIKEIVNNSTPKRFSIKKFFGAFLVGGLICLIAEIINTILDTKYSPEISSNITVSIMVFIGSIITGFGFYDKIASFAYAGTIIPITGFANSMTSSALESKSEGLFLGILPNMFKIAGSVIVTGVVSSFVISSIMYIFGWY